MLEGEFRTRRRVAQVFLLTAAAFLILFFRIAYLQFIRGDELRNAALENRLRSVPIQPKRGVIYDRNGKELALSISAPSVGAFPMEIRESGYEQKIATLLAEILELPADEVLKKITAPQAYNYVQRKISIEKAQKIRSLGDQLPGIQIVDESHRFYPNGQLAAHILGFAGIDNQGLEGIEYVYDQELRGAPGRFVAERDAEGREIPGAVQEYLAPLDGNSIKLTIDEVIQHIAERELDQLMASPTSPRRASIIVADPKTGEILAMASRPTFDPNNFGSFPAEWRRNPAISDAFEPGSIFKIVTVAAALEEGVVKPQDRFYDPGYIKIGPDRIKCWRSGNPHGSQSFAEGVANSCNPVFVEVGLRLEEKEAGTFYRYIRSFGFGSPTGVDLNGEAGGILIPPENLKPINIGTISIGQGIAVTPIQMVQAMSAIANGGMLVKPHLVKEVLSPDGQVVKTIEPQPVRQVISKDTAQQVVELLEGVVKDGTGKSAQIPGYRIGGKTGTAQKPGKGGYQPGKYVSSFLGFGPVEDPQLVVLVVIDEPQGAYYGGVIAAPVFKKVMEDTLKYLNIPPTEEITPENTAASGEANVLVPELRGLAIGSAETALKALNLVPEVKGSGTVVLSQEPEGFSRVKAGTRVVMVTGQEAKESGQVTVPDVTGLRIPQVTEILEAMNLKILPEGSGWAVEQEPRPGTRMSAGSAVKVIFSERGSEEALSP